MKLPRWARSRGVNISNPIERGVCDKMFKFFIFFYGGQGLNLGPCIYYALSFPTKLNSRGYKIFRFIWIMNKVKKI